MDIGEIKYLEVPAKVLKLSEAIRIGSRIRPQCFGEYYLLGGSCALGAAKEALGVANDAELRRMLGLPYDFPLQHIIHRNDNGQTREQIADWLESKGY